MSVVRRIQIGENHKSAEVLNRPTDDILTLSGQTPGATFAGFATTPALAAEATARGAGDTANASSIATNTAAISAEQTARAAADTALQALVAAAYPPSTIPNLVLWLDANGVTGLADNTAMSSWPNLAPGGAVVSQGNATYQPKFRTINGVPFVRNALNGGFGIAFGSAIAPDESTTFLVAQNPTVAQTQQCLFHLGPQDASAAAQQTYQVNQSLQQFSVGQAGSNYTGMVMPTTWAILTVAGSVSGSGIPEGSGAWVYLNGQRAYRQKNSNASGWTSVAPQSLGFMGAMSPGGAFGWTGDWRCVLHYNRRLSESEIARVHAYLSAAYSIPLVGATTKNIVAGLDSQTVGYTGTNPAVSSGYLDQFLKKQPTTVRSYNVGVVGQTLATALTLGSYYDSLYDATVAKNIFLAWGGTNDAEMGAGNPTAVYNRLVTFCQARRTKGFKVAVVTCLPRGAVAQYETDRQAYNTNIRTNWATFADAVVDIGGDATVGAAGAQNNSTNYQADLIHLTTAGYGIMEGLATTAVNSL